MSQYLLEEQKQSLAKWPSISLRYAADIRNSNVDKKSYENGAPVKLCNYTDVYYNEKITSALSFMRATATQNELERFQLMEGDVIITKDSESWDDIGVPACVDEPLPNVVCGYHLCLLRPKSEVLNGRYLLRALQSVGIREQLWLASRGVTRFGLGLDGIRDLQLPLPSLPTQKAIANFLDHKTTAIDALIEKKEKLLELLAEKRSALINQAVTKGLDPNVPMKDSGIPWIGEIPEHWEVLKLAWVLSDGPRNGVSPAVSNEETGFLSFSLAAIRRGLVDIRAEDTKHVLASTSDLQKFSLKPGDLLLIRGNGNIHLVGYTGLVKNENYAGFVYPDLLMRMRCNSRAEPAYLRYCLNSAAVRPQLTAAARTTVGTFKVNNEQVRELRVLVPPVAEAKRISQWIDQQCTQFHELRKNLEKHLKLLQEYRQSLITAAVTGQVEIPTEDYE